MVDPIVVTQLIAKRSEFAGLIDAKRGELNAILRDLDHLDAVIKLFAPEKVPARSHQIGHLPRRHEPMAVDPAEQLQIPEVYGEIGTGG